MYYEIEVNLARKGATPVWRALRDNADKVCTWKTEVDARAVLEKEKRGDDARIVRLSGMANEPPYQVLT